jgi:hypothetical protein
MMNLRSSRSLFVSLRSLFIAVLVVGASNNVNAAVVIHDDFEDGTLTRTPSGIDWFTHSHPRNALGMSIVDDSAGLGSGKALLVDPITTGQSIMGVFGAPVSLPAAIGSKLTLRFDMRNETNLPVVPRTIRFGLYDADEANFPDPAGFGGMDGDWDTSQPGSYFDPGVFVQQDNSLLLTCCPPSATRLREEPNSFPGNVGNLPFGGGDERNVAAPAGVFPGLAQPEGKNTFTLELERLAPGNGTGAWRITYTLDNGINPPASISGVHLGPEFFLSGITNSGSFDYFAFFYEGTFSGEFPNGYADFLIDNFSIEVVPEPATWVCMMTGLAGLGLRRRKCN